VTNDVELSAVSTKELRAATEKKNTMKMIKIEKQSETERK
jgi:hypothetical protein